MLSNAFQRSIHHHRSGQRVHIGSFSSLLGLVLCWGLGRTWEEYVFHAMDPINDARFYESLIKPPRQRTQEVIAFPFINLCYLSFSFYFISLVFPSFIFRLHLHDENVCPVYFQDIRNIYEQLRQLDMFSNLYNGPLKAICANARYERHSGHHVLYRYVKEGWN